MHRERERVCVCVCVWVGGEVRGSQQYKRGGERERDVCVHVSVWVSKIMSDFSDGA